MKYEIVREWRKSIRIFVRDQKVIVKAPHLVSKSVIDTFVKRHSTSLEKLLSPLESFLYLGKNIQIVPCKKGWHFEDEEFHSDEKRRENVEAFLKMEARAYILPRVRELAERFGDRYEKIRITSAKSRWGSCNSKGNLNFTWRLMRASPDLIDYVIIHELCHLTHMNHSKAFWNMVRSRLPEYEEMEKGLKELSILF